MHFEIINSESCSKETATKKRSEKPGYIICSSCGVEQHADRNVCWRCGTKFEKTNDLI